LRSDVTFFVDKNGSAKSTSPEGIAARCGFRGFLCGRHDLSICAFRIIETTSQDTEYYQLTKPFLDNLDAYLRHLWAGRPDNSDKKPHHHPAAGLVTNSR